MLAHTYASGVGHYGSASFRRLGCALSSVVALSACHGASITYGPDGAAGAAASAGDSADVAGSADIAGSSSSDGGSGGESEPASETPEWPVPNPPSLGLPNPESYDLTSTPGVVRDLVTGLDWMQDPGTNLYSRPDANSLCAALSLGGFDDWRVPTFIELVSLFDAAPGRDGARAPLYIASVFQAAGAYWSTSAVPAQPDLGRLLDFAAHQCGTSSVCSIGEAADPSKALGGAFCVRSMRAPAAAARYAVASDHITDTRTGLVWLVLPTAQQSGTHSAAASSCAALGNGARLPSITELLSITVPFLDTTAFKGWDAQDYAWSASAIPVLAGSFWAGAIGGGSEAALATETKHVECVR